MSFQDIVESSGFLFEDHKVTTDDGYILTLFRIRSKNFESGSPAVLLQHGIFDTADAWVMHDADKAPAFVLASQGYDIWLGNNRGTRYSLGHLKLQFDRPEDMAKYHDFSRREMALYD